MGSFLMVGRLPDHVERDDAAAYLSGATDVALSSDAQAALLQAWDAAPDEMAYSRPQRSVDDRLNHAAKLEGLKDSSEVLKRSRWRHLPLESYWLPVRSDTATDGPVFFGSTYGLLANPCRHRRPPHRTAWAPYLSRRKAFALLGGVMKVY
jgi:hypothetical protein